MNKKDIVYVLLEDDNEILGNGYGHPLYRQYLPTKRYIEILNKYNIKGTFYVDIAHYLFLKKNSYFKDFKFQAKTIEEVIKMLLENKMDVQMHLHSQWVNAEIMNDNVYVTDKWNIGQLTSKEQTDLFNEAFKELSSLLAKFNSISTLNSYKAGSWGLQPFKDLYDLFKEKGIKLVMGPIKGLKVDSLNFNYTELESDFYPFYTSKEDINKISNNNDVVVLPMTPTYLNWVDFVRYIFELKITNIFNKNKDMDISTMPEKIESLKPLSGKDKLNLGLKPFKTHLKINAQRFWYLKNTFNRSYKKIKQSDYDYKLMVIETHTKDFKNTFDDIDRFFAYVTNKYDNIEFITSNKLVSHIEGNILKPLRK
ncbi:polysaccharide deacetylase family protein [Psychroserpens sp. MEBiC05023]